MMRGAMLCVATAGLCELQNEHNDNKRQMKEKKMKKPRAKEKKPSEWKKKQTTSRAKRKREEKKIDGLVLIVHSTEFNVYTHI